MKFKLNFYTEYCQFYIADKISQRDTGSVDFWSDEAYADRLAIEDGILGVGTECYGPVKGELIMLDVINNEFMADHYDHIVEAGLELKSGTVQIIGCPTSEVELEFKIAPGMYRVRIYSSNLKSVDGDEGDDYYKIELWPDKNIERKVLKRYTRI
jgi:hypothetical protein